MGLPVLDIGGGNKIFAQEDDPTSVAGGSNFINEGDIWIDTNAPPYGGPSTTSANIRYLRQNDKWLSLQGNTRVVRDADGWNQGGRGTELVILDKKIDHSDYPTGTAVIAFIDGGNAWAQAKLWNHSWGHVRHHEGGNAWSGILTGNHIFINNLVPMVNGRVYHVTYGSTIYNGTSAEQDVDLDLQISDASASARVASAMKGLGSQIFVGSWFHHFTGTTGNQSVKIGTSGSPHGGYRWKRAWTSVVDIGAA